jgi:hypothetical protein
MLALTRNRNQKRKAAFMRRRKNKYNAKRTVYDGETYHSAAEAHYAKQLNLLVRAGVVSSWKRQVPYRFVVNGVYVSRYLADFVITYFDGSTEVVDVKGYPDRRWPMVKKLMRACHGIAIREVRVR